MSLGPILGKSRNSSKWRNNVKFFKEGKLIQACNVVLSPGYHMQGHMVQMILLIY